MKNQYWRYGIAILLSLTVSSAFAQATSSQYGPDGYPLYPKSIMTKDSNPTLVAKGEYLVKAGDCMACHTDTPHKGVPFAGGLGINTPFGTLFTPNITPDKKTGIGDWTQAQFLKAMKEGVAPNGSNYYPAFPYTYFNKVSDSDLVAIYAYLRTLPPVQRTNTPNEMIWPFSIRFMQWGWKVLFFEWHKGVYQYNSKETAQWNRGAYLVQGLGHCAMCHTPLFLGSAERKHLLTGGFVGGYYAPDITGHGLGDASVQDIVNVFKKDEMLRGAGKVQGPMEEVNHDSLRYLKDSDLEAIAVYLKTVKSSEPKKAAASIGPNTGKDIYEDHCAVCHGAGAAGAPKLGDSNAWAPRIAQGINVLYQHALNGYNSMPMKGTCISCSNAQIEAAVDYLVTNSKPGAVSFAPKSTVPTQPALTIADGKQIYAQHCAVCHDAGVNGAQKLGDQLAWAPLIKQNIDVLFEHAIRGYKNMPAKGGCKTCTDAQVIAATKYMAQQGAGKNSNYSLW